MWWLDAEEFVRLSERLLSHRARLYLKEKRLFAK